LQKAVLLTLVLSSCLAALAPASAAAVQPNARALVLGTTDFPNGATVQSQSTSPSPYFPRIAYASAYTRSFSSATVDSTKLSSLVDSAAVASSPDKLTAFMSTIIAAIRSKVGRTEIVSEIKLAYAAAAKTKIMGVGFLRDRTVHAGDEAVDLDFYVKTADATIDAGEIYVQEGSALEIAFFSSTAPGLDAGQSFRLAKTIAAKLKAASPSPPTNTSLPSISGSTTLGQLLTLTQGTWTGAPTTYQAQWLRCSSSGGSCVAIAGATGSSYAITSADVGVTLAVSVSATNAAGSTTASSLPTQQISTA
jgi:Ig domain of plant-specific actin-binding protein